MGCLLPAEADVGGGARARMGHYAPDESLLKPMKY